MAIGVLSDQKGLNPMHGQALFRAFPLAAAVTLILVGARTGLAQDATPAASSTGVTKLGKGMPANAPGNYLELDRTTLAPGAEIPTHVHPSAYVISVESGDFGFTDIKGEAQVMRAGSTTPEMIAAGPAVVGHAGDAFYEIGDIVHSARNVGQHPDDYRRGHPNTLHSTSSPGYGKEIG
jgi:quercetin dioxygenase-like cupin family protein